MVLLSVNMASSVQTWRHAAFHFNEWVELSSFDKPVDTQQHACGELCMWSANHYASRAKLFCACGQLMPFNNKPISCCIGVCYHGDFAILDIIVCSTSP